ncbi:phosphoadenylyl-sulfate reductase [Azovibrio restrictus]|uniref:phosphoadenylyl-sulfate reductase n=1 Tax=Azovibrio restrictus TaxID=146938 RepID=UPI0003FA9A22|nr:phosphoadenylyl-sulfate reductase [Azovibrio restrictus]
MSTISPLRAPAPGNPATHPELSEALHQAVSHKSGEALALLQTVATDFSPAVFANSLGAEDMVLTDLILRNRLPIEIFSLDTGRLPPETYDLMAQTEKHYGTRLTVYYPRHENAEAYVRIHGINAFYQSTELRKACCQIRKVEPLQRALAGKKAWITGMRAQQSTTREALAIRSFDAGNGLEKFNPLADWSEKEVWAYIRIHQVPYNALHDQFYPSIGCAPCTRPISLGEDIRAGRWWWENPETKECGLHIRKE